MAKPKFDYDSDDFYDELLALAMQGLTDAEIADSLEDKFGVSLDPETFSTMKNGHYISWNSEENAIRSARILKALERGRRKINSIVRGRYLKAALGGIKTKRKDITSRKLRVDGNYTEDEEIMTTESEIELAPNMQALATWLFNHDDEWRKASEANIQEAKYADELPDEINLNIAYNQKEDIELQERMRTPKNDE